MGITIAGILAHRPTLLHSFDIPEGDPAKNIPPMDKDHLARTIELHAGQFPMLYNDPDLIAFHIKSWAEGHQYKWNTLWNSLWYEYDLMVNIDYTETIREKIRDKGTSTGEVKDDGTSHMLTKGETSEDGTAHSVTKGETLEDGKEDKKTVTGEKSTTGHTSDGTSHAHTDTEGQTDNLYQGFNSNAHRPQNRQSADGSSTEDTNDHRRDDGTGSRDVTVTENGTAEKSTESEATADSTAKNAGKSETQADGTTGNVQASKGATTDNRLRDWEHRMVGDNSLRSPPESIKHERDIAALNVYAIIAGDFVEQFCVMVY